MAKLVLTETWLGRIDGRKGSCYSPAMMRLITLLTDFGIRDGYVGVMKGVIWGIAPQAQIADITHQIQPQNILEGALAYSRVASYFPPGTIHVGVVDPGVGTTRRPIAACLGERFFVGPDNGLCTTLAALAHAEGGHVEYVHLDRPQFWLADVSNVFHGRDIFAPAAAHLANGTPLSDMGTSISDPVFLSIPVPEKRENRWTGQVILIDHFGNLSTNLTRDHIGEIGRATIQIGEKTIHGLVKTFGEGQPGELVAMLGEADDLVIAVVNGNAAEYLGVRAAQTVEVLPG